MRTSIRVGLALTLAIVTAAACGYYDESLLKSSPLGSGGSGGDGIGGTGGNPAGGSPAGGAPSGGKGGATGGTAGGGASGTSGSGGSKGGAGGTAGASGHGGASGGMGGSSGGSTGGVGGTTGGSAGTAGTAGAAGSAGSGGTACTHSQPVGRPMMKNLGGTIEFDVAFRTADFHEGGDFKSFGYDLDKTCTCEGELDSCLPSKTAAAGSTCDGPDGKDNAAGSVIAAASLLGVMSSNLNTNIGMGGATILLRVRGYNGMADDDQVNVAWFVTKPLKVQTDAGSATPAWDGSDVWPISGSSVGKTAGKYDLENPLFVDANAYVSGGTLVAALKGDTALAIDPNFVVTLKATFLTATIVPDGASFKLPDGLIAGRWPAKNILGQLGYYKIFGSALCTDNPAYGTIKTKICDSVDILSNLGTPTDACDAISTAFSFTAEPAKIGDVTDPDPSTQNCPPATDPANDSCN